MTDEPGLTPEEAELKAAIDAVVESPSPKKLVVAGPGTGKTTLFKLILESSPDDPDKRIVLTFINNLKSDLEADLGHLAHAHTLHSFCLGLLHRTPSLRGALTQDARCCPNLASLISEDWEIIHQTEAPKFVSEMRALAEGNNLDFYLARGDYYDAVDFDDSVYRVHAAYALGHASPDSYDLVLIDEYQDFNRLEASIIDALGETSNMLVAGDDDQALYSQFRDASCDYIRGLSQAGEYEVFTLPYCMRCPKVLVDAVADIISRAREEHCLDGRIDKPYKHFPLAKGEDSAKYPTIANVRTSVQSKKVNYIGRFIAQAVDVIPPDEVQAAAAAGYPAALVIVARPYRDQIVEHLQESGYRIETRVEPASGIQRAAGLAILKEDPGSSLGWRILLHCDQPSFGSASIAATADGSVALVDTLPAEYREPCMEEAAAFEPPDDVDVEGHPADEDERPLVRVTSFEGSKGLSAQHVFIAGLHDGELPGDPAAVKDMEICRFIVGLTRTRKRCYLIHTGHFGTKWLKPSCFISWIASERLEDVVVNKDYWSDDGDGE
ncbi:UvrD-helicase domain-containing protein [Anaerosoma tenue]|uniref:UvrD-helicase domain-containing protein n=1 Tax=Anaerosoma tenue TaxID=2933588 RepID=UPI002260EB3D|nr:UvrD-helicase domain-containing protein [Anaerosoma tenue]MCK8114795.1 AAA family ATPase [Anaerosoma tenue]